MKKQFTEEKHRRAEGGRCRSQGGGPVSPARHLGSDVLQLEGTMRRNDRF